MLHYLIRRADQNSKPLTAAQRRRAMMWTLVIAVIVVVIIAHAISG